MHVPLHAVNKNKVKNDVNETKRKENDRVKKSWDSNDKNDINDKLSWDLETRDRFWDIGDNFIPTNNQSRPQRFRDKNPNAASDEIKSPKIAKYADSNKIWTNDTSNKIIAEDMIFRETNKDNKNCKILQNDLRIFQDHNTKIPWASKNEGGDLSKISFEKESRFSDIFTKDEDNNKHSSSDFNKTARCTSNSVKKRESSADENKFGKDREKMQNLQMSRVHRPHSWFAGDDCTSLASIPEPYSTSSASVSSDVAALISPQDSSKRPQATIVSVHNPKSSKEIKTTTAVVQPSRKFELRFIKTFIHGSTDKKINEETSNPKIQGTNISSDNTRTNSGRSMASGNTVNASSGNTTAVTNGNGTILGNSVISGGNTKSAAGNARNISLSGNTLNDAMGVANGGPVLPDDATRGLLKSSSGNLLINNKPILKANKSAGSLLPHFGHQNHHHTPYHQHQFGVGAAGGAGLVSSVSAADLAQLNRRLLRSAVPLLRHHNPTAAAAVSGAGQLQQRHSERERVNSLGDLTIRPNSMGEHGRCSRCSSLLSMASGGSRYSLAQGGGGFVPVEESRDESRPDSRDSRDAIPGPAITCKLCLTDTREVTKLEKCGCVFCTECMRSYVRFEVLSGAYSVSCPDAECPSRGAASLGQGEIRGLAGEQLLHKHNQYRLNREIDLDRTRTWCPRAGCETVCSVPPPPTSPGVAGAGGSGSPTKKGGGPSTSPTSKAQRIAPLPACPVQCPTCSDEFCSSCKKQWHPGQTCEQYLQTLGAEEAYPLLLPGGGAGGSELIKSCPLCAVPIEKDEGCAQMMCKRCKHVFCWYCLTSLDDDFLLRHYDKGPCKNKLGHSRASVIWHRTQVIGIFAGFGILLLVASPLLLLAAPCIVCCKCRVCNGATRLEQDGEQEDDEDDDVIQDGGS